MRSMRPFQLLFLGFLLVPMLEIYLLIKVGSLIGALPTILLVIFTAVLGAFLMRVQGFSTLQKVRLALSRGEVPATTLLEGLLLMVAGVLLLIPGFFTDTLGFLLLVPPLRRRLAGWLLARGLLQAAAGPVSRPGTGAPGETSPGGRDRQGHPRTLEGDYHRED